MCQATILRDKNVAYAELPGRYEGEPPVSVHPWDQKKFPLKV